MKILLVYPQFPDTFWSFKHALRFVSKKAAVPPLGLVTVSAMFPDNWEKKLVDLNVGSLELKDLLWADYVFISAMYVHQESVKNIIKECKDHALKMVAGGPLFTQEYQNYPEIDHFILNEAEITMPLFLDDLLSGREPDRLYCADEFAKMKDSPVPDFHLLSRKDYASMNIQISRGCPYACDFCEITSLLGHKVRMKTTKQVISELDALYRLNWRGPISIVDDNLIGKRKHIKKDLLPAMRSWMQDHKYPFTFSAQTSINLADDDELMTLMRESGFSSTFIGIETPEEKSLQACNKAQNRNRDLLHSVKKIQRKGMQVSGGFIVGFDSDTPSVFERQIEFIQQSGIVSAMVGLLNAPKNTELYNRLKSENRLTTVATGNNTDFSMNFIPKMDFTELEKGYRNIIENIYSVKPYYQRIRKMLLNYQRYHRVRKKIELSHLKALFRSFFIIGMVDKGRTEFWKLMVWTLFHRPRAFIDVMTFVVYGYHFRIIYGLRNK